MRKEYDFSEAVPNPYTSKPKKNTYTLKPLVLARLFAEISVLLLLIALPAIIYCVPHLHTLPDKFKIITYILALPALCLLPFYGYITWRVNIDEQGLTAIALFKKQFAAWSKLEKLTFRSSWGWRRYAVSFDGGELTFPIWLANVKELTKIIRDCLPDQAGVAHGREQRIFKQDIFSLLKQFGQVLMGILFIILFWLFFATVGSGRGLNPSDYWLILITGIFVTILVGWRSMVIVLMPRSLEITDAGLVIKTCFYQCQISWAQVKELKPSFFLLPEGLTLKTNCGSFLLTEDLNAVDELEEVLRKKLVAANT